MHTSFHINYLFVLLPLSQLLKRAQKHGALSLERANENISQQAPAIRNPADRSLLAPASLLHMACSMMAATSLLAAILMANASLTIAFISQQSLHEHPSLWYQTNPLITHHFHLSASEDDEQIISQTQNLKELASQIDVDSKTTRPRYELGVGKNMPIAAQDTAVQPKNGDVDLQSLRL